MNDEIKEILDRFEKLNVNILYPFEMEASDCKKLLDYITNLQQENEEWGMIFDTFSSRPYAHRYLEEKRKELGNKRIMGLDSEMIYREYYDLKEIEQDHKETNATLMSELVKLEEENERLKEWKKDLLNENIELENIRKEAIEYINNHLYMESTAGIQHPTFDGKPSYDFDCFDLLDILQNGSEEK